VWRAMSVVLGMAAMTAGCGRPWNNMTMPAKEADGLRLLGLTELELNTTGDGVQVQVYVQVSEDIEATRFRFELYEFVPYDANPRGRRLVLWPDIEIGPAGVTNRYWRGHLGAYEFVLPVEPRPAAGKTYLLEVTAIGERTRLNDMIKLNLKHS